MAEVNHAQRKHALLSASGSERWMRCTPSARLEEKFPEKSSIYADEGTLAHEFGNIRLLKENGEITEKVQNQELRKLRKHKLYTSEMEPEVEKYVTLVMELFAEAKARSKDAKLLVEQRLDFSHVVKQGFGTGDALIAADRILDVGDLKYGKGVSVDAFDNSQLKLYGLGALRRFDLDYDIEQVRLHIFQPRLDSYTTHTIDADELRRWGEEHVKPKAELAYAGDGDYEPGDWCKFCKAKPVCRALAEQNLRLAKYEFRDAVELEDYELLDIMKQASAFTDWLSAIKAHVQSEALKGKKWEGFKLVAGKSDRRWTSEEEVVEILLKNNFKKEDIYQTKLHGITKIQALVGTKNIATLLGDQIIKPEGAPTLVPESDKRLELNSLEKAKSDFAGPEED